ncbi:MAG TPA: ABC transporter substrate-binding protein [Alphaproteobacteria bacterium]|jgi:NitT/TauT family transport system substrate-binding protein|nr:ABC transporter substrate-binding protein [Alphaproteobacteria bacterium]MDP6270011.1 ABC transporter substrate-binding protein [Alphaproteobacteria bacterium]HJM51343.1 ABC transporter substrate-binding protein [Alphaproteobacteria bacterium]
MAYLLRSAAAAAVVFAFAAGSAGSAGAATEVNFILNWIAGGDHAPYYYAQSQGWYAKAGIDLNIEQGKGSGFSAQRTGIGKSQIGLADMPPVFAAIAKGGKMVAVYNVYANSPYGFYWLKSKGISGPKDFAGRKIGNPPWDAARQMWPAFATNVGIGVKSVTWVNIKPNAKLAALLSGSIDVTTSFYNIHHIFQAKLGADMGYVSGKAHGVNPYGNSIIANGKFLAGNRAAVAAFVKVTQKAFHACATNAAPCIQALVKANKGLKAANETANWGLVKELMTDEISTGVGLGYMDPGRMAKSYEIFKSYLAKPFDVTQHYSNEFIDKSVKLPK